MPNPKNLKVKIFADGADLETIKNFNDNPIISGFTTNPTLMRSSGVTDYEKFVKNACDIVVDKPISFEVISDDLEEMESQARRIASWADNVYVKIPIYNTKKECTKEIIKNLNHDGVKINVTAVFTDDQVKSVLDNINGIGNVLKTRLMKKFKNIQKIKDASIEQLMTVDGINEKMAKNIQNELR